MKRIVMSMMAVTLAQALSAKAEWYDDVRIKGDVRYRHEQIVSQGSGDVQLRERMRARLSANARISSEVNAVIGLTTTEAGDPISGNQTMKDGGTKKSAYIDMAYLDYHPELLKGFSVLGGKLKNPYIAVSDLVWDGDYTPEGLAAQYHWGDTVEVLANAANFWLRETNPGKDATQYGAQLAANVKTLDPVEVMVGCSYYATADLEGAQVLDYKSSNNSYGNSTKNLVSGSTTNKGYQFEYTVIEPFVQVRVNTKIPVRVYGQYAKNTDADKYDAGYLAGVTVGLAKDPKTFELTYAYRQLEKDCVLGAFTDSDNGGGGTDYKGHKFQAKYQIGKGLQAAATYFLDDRAISADKTKNYERLQLDLVASF